MIVTITTYKELADYAASFALGTLNLLIVVGDAGLGKSRALKAAVDENVRIIEGQLSAFQLYREVYNNLDQPLVIDDVDKLYVDKDCVRLLKCLCQTEHIKTLQWNTASSQLAGSNTPREFQTSSPVCIIANEFKTLNPNTKAIADRGITVKFEPDAKEVHRQVSSWFDDKEIYKFIGDNLDQIITPSQRIYFTARDMKRSKLDWRKALMETWNANTDVVALKGVFSDETLTTQAQRIAAWITLTGKDRATFYRIASRFPELATLRHYAGVR